MTRHAIFLDGPIGAGKTTLGWALAERLGGGFIDGDDHSERGRPWYCSSLRTSRGIVAAALALLDIRPTVVIAYPLRCVSWIYFRRTLTAAGVIPLFLGLRASYDAIVAQQRGRVFTDTEHRRIRVMITEGYGARPFSDLVVDTGDADLTTALSRIETGLAGLPAFRPAAAE